MVCPAFAREVLEEALEQGVDAPLRQELPLERRTHHADAASAARMRRSMSSARQTSRVMNLFKHRSTSGLERACAARRGARRTPSRERCTGNARGPREAGRRVRVDALRGTVHVDA